MRVKTVEDRLFWKIVGVGLLVAGDGESGPVGEDGITDEEYHRAYDIVVEANRASASMLQQRMGIGYNHASRIMHLFEKRGVIGPPRGAAPREVLVGK